MSRYYSLLILRLPTTREGRRILWWFASTQCWYSFSILQPCHFWKGVLKCFESNICSERFTSTLHNEHTSMAGQWASEHLISSRVGEGATTGTRMPDFHHPRILSVSCTACDMNFRETTCKRKLDLPLNDLRASACSLGSWERISCHILCSGYNQYSPVPSCNPWWWYNMEVTPSNLKPSQLYSSSHQRRLDNKYPE